MKYLLAVALLLCAVPAHAAPLPDAPTPNKKIFWTGVGFLAAAKTADAITTRQLLNRGGVELNSLYGRHPSAAKQSLINLGFFAAESAVFYLTERNHHKPIRWIGRAWMGNRIVNHAYLAACNANVRVGTSDSCYPLVPIE